MDRSRESPLNPTESRFAHGLNESFATHSAAKRTLIRTVFDQDCLRTHRDFMSPRLMLLAVPRARPARAPPWKSKSALKLVRFTAAQGRVFGGTSGMDGPRPFNAWAAF